MTYRHLAAVAMLCVPLTFLAACGGGGGSGSGGGTGFDAGPGSPAVIEKGPLAASLADHSATFTQGETIGIAIENVAPGELSADFDGTTTPVAQQDEDEAVVVVPDLPAGSHTLTLKANGHTVTLHIEVSALNLTGDARQSLQDLIDEALALLNAHLKANPTDTAAAGLRDRLAATSASIGSATQEQLDALHRQFTANGLQKADAPGSCHSAPAQYKVRLRKMMNTARSASWLAMRHADSRSTASEAAALLAQAQMEESWRRLLAYADATTQLCGQDVLAADTERGRKARGRAVAAAARL